MATNKKILDCISGDSDVRRTRKAVWKRVALELNRAGPKKDITQWRKVWTDLRLGMRKKWDKAQKSEYILTEYERRVIDACGMVEKSGDEDSKEKSADEINNFLQFLEEELIREHTPGQDYSDYYKEENSNSGSYYLGDSSEFIIRHCQPTDSDFASKKKDFDEESAHFVDFDERSVEYISDDDPTTTRLEDRDFREPSIECISDDEEPMITNERKLEESPPHLPYEQEEPVLSNIAPPQPIMPIYAIPESETVPQPILLQSPEPQQVPSLLSLSEIVPQRRKIKSATLKEISKMHRNLLRESKKQTALLRKLVQGIGK